MSQTWCHKWNAHLPTKFASHLNRCNVIYSLTFFTLIATPFKHIFVNFLLIYVQWWAQHCSIVQWPFNCIKSAPILLSALWTPCWSFTFSSLMLNTVPKEVSQHSYVSFSAHILWRFHIYLWLFSLFEMHRNLVQFVPFLYITVPIDCILMSI